MGQVPARCSDNRSPTQAQALLRGCLIEARSPVGGGSVDPPQRNAAEIIPARPGAQTPFPPARPGKRRRFLLDDPMDVSPAATAELGSRSKRLRADAARTGELR